MSQDSPQNPEGKRMKNPEADPPMLELASANATEQASRDASEPPRVIAELVAPTLEEIPELPSGSSEKLRKQPSSPEAEPLESAPLRKSIPPISPTTTDTSPLPPVLESETANFETPELKHISESRSESTPSTTNRSDSAPAAETKQTRKPIYLWPIWFAGRSWDIACLSVLLAVVAAIPAFQLASLGYLLVASANLAERKPWRSAFPGLRLAGKLGTFALLAALTWLPVWLITDLAYSAQLLQPGSPSANRWRISAFIVTGLWLTHLYWAAMRGGRWWHLLWPAPVRFFKEIWRPVTWSTASDRLYDLAASLQFPRLWWLGARASVGVLLWITLPVSMMIIGQRAESGPTGLVGFVGAVGMIVIMLYLPFLQIQLAVHNRFTAIFDVLETRRRFRYAPIFHAIALVALVALCIPLYLLRIEATPDELVWAPALVFVLFMLPAKILIGTAMGYAKGREERGLSFRNWILRWPSRLLCLASVLIYVGSLYVAQLVAGQGALVMYFQHAFLVPAPLI